MQVGDYVKVNLKRHGRKYGIIVKKHEDESNCVIVIQPINHGRTVWANPADVEVISESR